MFALTIGVAFTSCEDQLDIDQKGVVPTDQFYKNDDDCLKALAGAYEEFNVNTVGRGSEYIFTPAKVMANDAGDDVNYGGTCYGDHEFGGSVDEFRYQHTPNAINAHYQGLYLSIFKDNIVLTYFKDPATKFQRQAVAEAKVLRAYNFFLLACYWGQPPFIDHMMTGDEVPTNSEMTQQEYFVWVAQQCEEALPDLTERENTGDKEGCYRVTKGFANALAGKAYMFAGEFEKAKAALWKVIDSKKYELVSGDEFLDLFHKEGDGCKEKVFEVNLKYNSAAGQWSFGGGNGWGNHNTWMEADCFNWRGDHFVSGTNPVRLYTGIDGWGSIGVTEWFGEDFHNNDGDSKRFKATLIHIDDAVYQTSGIEGLTYASDELNNMTLEQKKVSDKIGIDDKTQGLYGQSFYLPFKMLIRTGDVDDGGTHGSDWRLNNIIIMRYAEVLLNYAECCLRTGDAASAKTYINMIQERAGSKTVSNTVDLITLKKEKSYELWFEGCRFQDILRWSKLDNDSYDQECIARLKKAGSATPRLFDKVHRPVVTEDVYENGVLKQKKDENVVWEHGTEANSRFYIAHTHEAKDEGYEVGFQEKHRLFPYPTSVRDQNPNLKQKGWDY